MNDQDQTDDRGTEADEVERLRRALDDEQKSALRLRILGSYPAAPTAPS